MRWTQKVAITALMLTASAPAYAADWWWVAGEPGGNAAIFIDADTVVKSDGAVTFEMQQIRRDGQAMETIRRMPCNAPSDSSDDEAMRRFACATARERMSFAMIVAPMTPLETARLIFAMPKRT